MIPESREPKPWMRLRSEPGPDLALFKARFDTLRHPRTLLDRRWTVLETRDWCGIVAVTRDRRIVLVRQYRPAVQSVTLEIPGGTVEPGEDHRTAAERELLEETGYAAHRWTPLGSVSPNTAFHDNRCHYWLAEDAVVAHERAAEADDVFVVTLSLEEVKRAVAEGLLANALGIAGLSRVVDLRTGTL